MIEAMVNLQAAITNEVASLWAKRMNMDAVETAKMPNRMATKGGTGGCLGEFIFQGVIIDEMHQILWGFGFQAFRICQITLPKISPRLTVPNTRLSMLSGWLPMTFKPPSGLMFWMRLISNPYPGWWKAITSPGDGGTKKKGILLTSTKSPSLYSGARLSPVTFKNLSITGRDTPTPMLGRKGLWLAWWRCLWFPKTSGQIH